MLMYRTHHITSRNRYIHHMPKTHTLKCKMLECAWFYWWKFHSETALKLAEAFKRTNNNKNRRSEANLWIHKLHMSHKIAHHSLIFLSLSFYSLEFETCLHAINYFTIVWFIIRVIPCFSTGPFFYPNACHFHNSFISSAKKIFFPSFIFLASMICISVIY